MPISAIVGAIGASVLGIALLASILGAGPTPARADRAAPVEAPAGARWSSISSPPGRRAPPPPRYVRTRGDRFEIVEEGRAHEAFFRGVNLGAGTPGHFPGEFAATKDDYRRWLGFLRDLHANAVRIYALHPPAFYEALVEENEANPGHPIWLFQEVWTELPEKEDFLDTGFTERFENEIRAAVDAIHGNAIVEPRRGHASGRYTTDASRYLAGWLLGREWEPYAVRETERRHREVTRFRGTYFRVDGGTPMECWLARICETAVGYEIDRYGLARAVSFVTWPTLDPMRHPTEYERGGTEAEHDEDAYSVDPTRLHPRRAASLESSFLGYFVNYHVYPYYPDFMNLDPGYASYEDRHGACSYAGYLQDLKANTRGIPLLIGEFGVPVSRGIAHLQPQGINHGGADEVEQGAHDVRLLDDIVDAGAAGALLFALYDEWFKVNWLVSRSETPRDRDPLWHNVLDPEEGYGLIAFDPPPAIELDGRTDDWSGVAPYAREDTLGAGGGRGRRGPSQGSLRALFVSADATRLYIRIDAEPDRLPQAIGVSLDILDGNRGDQRLPRPLDAVWSRGAEFVLLIEPKRARAELFIDDRFGYSSYARVREGESIEIHRAPLRTAANGDGRYLPLLIETNRERVGRDGSRYPARYLDWGRLVRAENANGGRPGGARRRGGDWALNEAAGVIEVGIPWGLLNVGDPSSRCVLDDDPATPQVECAPTDGLALLAWATEAACFRADSLGPSSASCKGAGPEPISDLLAPTGTVQVSDGYGLTITTPSAHVYLWNGWEAPITVERIKASADFIRGLYEGMEARETSSTRTEE